LIFGYATYPVKRQPQAETAEETGGSVEKQRLGCLYPRKREHASAAIDKLSEGKDRATFYSFPTVTVGRGDVGDFSRI
jgi:hypothetical protein